MKYIYNVFVMASVLLFVVSCKKDVPPHGGTTRHSVLTLEEDKSESFLKIRSVMLSSFHWKTNVNV